jgi:hypothetical protein
MSDDNSATPSYRITLTPDRGEPFSSFIICACIKQPFVRKASFWYLKLNVSTIWAQQLFDDLGSNSRTTFNFKIESGKYEGGTDHWKTTSVIHNKPCKCIHAINAQSNYKLDKSNMNSEIIMILVDHILFDMSIKNSFNRKLENITAFQAFQQYEQSLKSHYSANTFNSNQIGIIDSQKSDYVYEQILLTVQNDLHISDLLLYSKKMMKSHTFHFYDDFYLDKNNKNHITSHFICLANINEFKPFDITKYFDTLLQTTILSEKPFSDTFKKFTQGFDVFSVSSPLMVDSNLVPESINSLFNPTVTDVSLNDYLINNERDISGTTSSVSFQKSTNRQKCMRITTPDSEKLARERLENYSYFINSVVKNLVIIQSVDSFCDWIQFGYSYNLAVDKPTEFLYTPIMIANIFYKDSHSSSLKHISKSLMLEYYNKSYQPCSGCKWFKDKACTLHYGKKSDKDSCKDFTAIGS